MIVKVIDNFLRSDYVRNILRLFSGTSLSQLIPILISPILTRLYTAEQFGFFATYVSAYTLLSVLSDFFSCSEIHFESIQENFYHGIETSKLG